MKSLALLAATLLWGTLAAGTAVAQPPSPPPWAYPVNPPGSTPPPDDGSARQVPGSSRTYTLSQVRDFFLAPDWHPEDHAPMPGVVAHGRKPEVPACGFCHRAEGTGGPENASLAGLSAPYITQQMIDFASGARSSSVAHRAPTELMASLARAASVDEVAAAAAYFSALKPKTNIRVVETATVPVTHVSGWHLAASTAGGTEPLGQRIVEVPEDLQQFVSRDSRARFIAYVPVGSLRRGQALASGGAGGSVSCGSCHGHDLRGLGAVPRIAGRSPSYIVRQLYDFQHGARAGPASAPMKPSAEGLTIDEMIAVAAYTASLPP